MRDIAELLNSMKMSGVILDYALFGAAAQIRYTEPVSTLDADVLIDVPSTDRIDILSPIYKFCTERGHTTEGEAIRVGAWPVQFIPVFSPLTREALNQADTTEFEGVPFRVVRADYLAVIALSVGRSKDSARILSLLESGTVTTGEIEELATRHNLSDTWKKFVRRFLSE